MICPACAEAADGRLDRAAHCGSAGGPGSSCDCQHLTDRYRAETGFAVLAAHYAQLDRVTAEIPELHPRQGPVKVYGPGTAE